MFSKLVGQRTVKYLVGLSVGEGTRINLFSALRLRGKNVVVGSNSILNCRISFDKSSASVRIGNRCYIGASHIVAAECVEIDDDVIISWGVTIVDHNSHSLKWENRRHDVTNWAIGIKDWTDVTIRPIKLRKKCWIGFNAVILKGVTVGEGAIVGACSVVTKDVAPYTIVAGNPARVIGQIEMPND